MPRNAATLLIVSLSLAPSSAQSPSSFPAFDIASIHPMNYPADARTHIYNSHKTSEFKAVNVTLRALLEVAYDIPETQMQGGPTWTTTDKFDLEAKSDTKLDEHLAALPFSDSKQLKRQMLRTLLADRFKLTAHTETRALPIFALVLAKGGAKLSKSDANRTTLNGGRGSIRIQGGNDSLAVLAFELSWRLGRPVIDQTGLAGRYDLSLTWTPDDALPSADSAAPSLFTAIQEQLGLKLQPTKGPVPILIIDHAEKPSQN